MKELRTEVEIAAPPHRVWAVLSDFASHPEWNPFIRSIEGELREGARLSVRLGPPGGKVVTFRPIVLRAVENEELRWLGNLVLPGIFDGEHIFQLEPMDAGRRTRFVQREEFRGILVRLFSKFLDTDTRRGFEAMNEAIKERAETSGLEPSNADRLPGSE
jgi:hypothetical protein